MKEMVEEYQIVYKEQEPYEVLETKWLPYEDILRLKMVESMVEVYYNSGQFQNTIACIEPLLRMRLPCTRNWDSTMRKRLF